jgi:protein SCO1/2
MAARPVETLLWSVLVAVMIGVVVRFVISPRGNPPRENALPVLREVSDFRLTNQLGSPITLNDLRGQVSVFNVIFSRCPGQCQQLSQQMKAVQADIPPGVQLYSLTADPDYDTATVLQQYGRRFGANDTHWQFLTGSKNELYRLATSNLLFAVVDNSAAPDVSLENLFIHSTDFAFVDRRGRLRGVVHGEETNAVARILETARKLARE